MPISQADEDVLGECYRNLQVEKVERGDRFYVEIWEHSGHDPVARLAKHIKWTENQSLQLFSGFLGSGKTTQLRRLQRELSERGYLVVYADAATYLNLSEPIEVEELLITLAGALSDNIDPALHRESYWQRLVNYLGTTEVNLQQLTFKHTAAEFKAELKTSPTFRQRVRQAIQSQLPEVRRQMDAFIQEVVKAVRDRNPAQRVVFLFDSLEKLRGSPSNEAEVMHSVERLFGQYMGVLRLPSIHCVYSVPAFIRFLVTDCELVLIPTIKLWKKRELGQVDEVPHEPGRQILRELVARRFGDHAIGRIFGDPGDDGLRSPFESLITASGGALVDLFRLFREALLAAHSLPISDRVALQAIATMRNDFRTTIEDARWLRKIHTEQAADPETARAVDILRYMRLLDTHLVLFFKNDADWYDSHPLVREEVERILALNPAPLPAPGE
jgi:hypothetical protein